MRRAFAAVLLLMASPAAAEPPAALIEATEEAVALCTRLGGAPVILDGYRVTRDLNGDAADDFLTDLARLECGGAWSAFCGSSGCPVTAWLSGPDGGYARFDFGRLLGAAIREASPLPEVVARYAAPFCDGAADGCTRTWVFSSNGPDTPPVDAAPPPVPVPDALSEAAPAPATSPSPPAAAAPTEPLFAGWSLRRVPGASPVALGTGVGNIATLAGFCLGGDPFLALTFHRRPDADSVRLGFDFDDGPVEVEAGFEQTAGGAFVAPLDVGPLAARLAGRDSEVAVSVDDRSEGTLSLAGSTRALRGALGDCGGL